MGFKRRYKNIVEKFLSGEQGKRFFHVAYSLGASIIIIGVLAKLMHWPYGLGNTIMYIGFISEAIIFAISAFDQPTKEWQWDAVFPVLDTNDADDRPTFGAGGGGGSVVIGDSTGASNSAGNSGNGSAGGGGVSGGGGPIIIGGANFGGGGFGGGGYSGGNAGSSDAPTSAVAAVENMTSGQVRQSFGIPNAVEISEEDSNALTASIKKMAAAADQLSKMAEMTDATQQYLGQLTEMSENMQKFSSVTNSLTDVSDILLGSYKSITDNSDGINQSSRGYVQQMESLNRNIQGLNTIYEIQLKSVSSQIDAIERINSGLMRIKDLYEGSIVDSSVFRSETEKMAQQLHALNGVYNRLLNAMTMNMYGAGGIPNFNVNPNSNV
jgi:gliding motility-associated protein GldL